MGALDYLSNFCTDVSTTRSRRKPMQTVEIKVKMDCDGCERRVKNAVTHMKGVKSVEVNRKESLVTVSEYVDPNQVLKRIRRNGKNRAEFWPYIPQHLVHYISLMFPASTTRGRPAGYVRNINIVQPSSVSSNAPEEKFMYVLLQ